MWSIVPREPDLSRLYDPLSKWSSLDLVERYLEPDTWSVTGPIEYMEVFDEGAGSILFSNGEQVTSGEVLDIEAGATTDAQGRMRETLTATFASDLVVLGDRIVVPSPTYASPIGTIFQFPDAYDLRTGAIETLITGYIRSHIGDLARTERRLTRLRVPASLGRGGSTTVSGRFDNLGTLVASLAEAGNLRVRVVHTEDTGGAWLDVVIDPITDLSADVRFGTSRSTSGGRITDWSWRKRRPTATRAYVAGGGELAARDIVLLTSPAVETAWNRSVEVLVDQRNIAPDSTNKLGELTREGQKELTEGAGLIDVRFRPRLHSDVVYRRDIRIGDIVGYDLPRLPPSKDKIRQVRTEVVVRNGAPTEQVTITVGTPNAPEEDPAGGQTSRALREVNALQRSQ